MDDAAPEDYGTYPPPHVMQERIERLERERDDAFRKRDDAVALGIELTGKVEQLRTENARLRYRVKHGIQEDMPAMGLLDENDNGGEQ